MWPCALPPHGSFDNLLGYSERYTHRAQAQQPDDQLDEDAHHEQLGGRSGARSGGQAFQVLDSDEDGGGQDRGLRDLIAGAGDAALVQPLPERTVLEKHPQG